MREAAEVFTELVLAVFRVHGALIAAGDALVADLGLTSARWQVLGMVVDHPLTVSAIARRVGVTRQNVQRLADRLVRDGLAVTEPNPDHATAPLLALSARGREIMDEVGRRQRGWAERSAEGLDPAVLESSLELLRHLAERVHPLRGGDA
nr:MarR family winged helix-turn-helix transcriptional regulator [uncultured Holophaga sp.]